MPKRNKYSYLWGNYQSLLTIEMNILPFCDRQDFEWNISHGCIEVAEENRIRCFYSNKDFPMWIKMGEMFLDLVYARAFVAGAERIYDDTWRLFRKMQKIVPRSLSNEELWEVFSQLTGQWSREMGYFRATQQGSISVLLDVLNQHFGEEKTLLLIQPTQLDIVAKELIAWRELKQKKKNDKILLDHAAAFPWIVASHFTWDDVLETLHQRWESSVIENITQEERRALNEKQQAILKGADEMLRDRVALIQRLALNRMEIKSLWAGTDFYLIPILTELARRSKQDQKTIGKYYLTADLEKLLAGIPLSEEEIARRRNCFVGLYKNDRVRFFSGEEARKVAHKELGHLLIIPHVKELRGMTVSKGLARGIVRILGANDMERARFLRNNFKKGEILVTQMTQPNIMDIARRAGAIITDEGGMLSHAAVISREFGIPCIVGTDIATQVLHDGDLVEVDADEGVVRIVEKGDDFVSKNKGN